MRTVLKPMEKLEFYEAPTAQIVEVKTEGIMLTDSKEQYEDVLW